MYISSFTPFTPPVFYYFKLNFKKFNNIFNEQIKQYIKRCTMMGDIMMGGGGGDQFVVNELAPLVG